MKTMEKAISIVVPVYNAKQYLRECIDSLIGQTLSDLEIIFVNDASTDTSLDILLEYQALYPDMVCVYSLQINSKQGAARNFGIKKAQGKYILFVDSDDVLEPMACELLYKKAEAEGADIVFCDYIMFSDHAETYCQHVQNIYLGELTIEKRKALLTTSVVPWAKLLLRELLLKYEIYFPEHVFYEDQATTYLYYLYAKKAAKIETALYGYRLREHSTSTEKNMSRHFEQADMALELVRRVKERGFLQTYQSEMDFFLLEQMYCIGVESCFLKFENPPVEYLDKLLMYLNKFCPAYKENSYYRKYSSEYYKKMLESHQKSVQTLLSEYNSGRLASYCPNYTYQIENSCEKLEGLSAFFQKKKYRTVLWGAGKYGRYILHCFKEVNFRFDYLVDRNPDLWGKTYGDYVVSSPDIIKDVDIVIIEFTGFAYEIRRSAKQLKADIKTMDLECFIKYDLSLPYEKYLE